MVPQLSCTGCRDSTLKEACRITAQAGHILTLFIHNYIHTYIHTCIHTYIPLQEVQELKDICREYCTALRRSCGGVAPASRGGCW